MKRYLISYDLLTPGKNYDLLIRALVGLGAKKVLYSQWVVRNQNSNAAGLLAFVRQYVDSNDRILVDCLDAFDLASVNTISDPKTV